MANQICSLCDKKMLFYQSKILSNLVMHGDWKEEVHLKCHNKKITLGHGGEDE